MEVEGRDYFFVDRQKFEGWIQDDMLLEHANVYGDYKGIPRQQVCACMCLFVCPSVCVPVCNAGLCSFNMKQCLCGLEMVTASQDISGTRSCSIACGGEGMQS
jgi:hypothetical protein